MDVARQVKNRFNALKNERQHVMQIWQDVTDFVNPYRGRYNVANRNLRGTSAKKIYDSTPAGMQSTLSAGLMSGMTSPARPWFGLTTADPDLAKNYEVKNWCHETTERMRSVFRKSNIYRVLHTMYDELALFGTAATVIDNHHENVIHGFPLTAGEYCIAVDVYSNVDTLYREFQLTARSVVNRFGIENCPTHIVSAYEKGDFDTMFNIVHAIEPRHDRDVTSISAKDMPYRSVYITDTGHLLSESGYTRFPVLAPRWNVMDDYGISPAMMALPDIRQLQHEQLRKAQGIDQQNNPTRILPATLKNAGSSLLPGGIIYANPQEMAGIRSAFDIRPDITGLREDIAEVTARIATAFYTDLFRMFEQRDSQMTATEVAERQSEKMLMLGPVLERLDNELLSPLIEMTFEKMLKAGRVPALPDALNGQEIVIEYTSVLAQAQKQTAANSQARFLNTLGVIAQLKPDVLDKFDADAAVDDLADSYGVNPKTIVSSEDVALIRQQRAQAEQQQQQMMQQAAQAQQMKDLSQVNTQTLGEILQGYQGYGDLYGV